MNKAENPVIDPSSFKDPSGFIFYHHQTPYRQINISYKKNYDLLMQSNLYKTLVNEGYLISHEETTDVPSCSDQSYKIIKPTQIPFISYPYEWCFSQLKAAALLTLTIQKETLRWGMSLKDASAYNIQFMGCKPILIDTLSFEEYQEGSPWTAYRQFCQHFLSPLALMAYQDLRTGKLLSSYLDGIPLGLTSALLPFHSRLNPLILGHIHGHAWAEQQLSGKTPQWNKHHFKKTSLPGILDHLESGIRKLNCRVQSNEWTEYYSRTSYSPAALEHKKQIVNEGLDFIKPKQVWDFGCNNSAFGKLANAKGIPVISFDNDPHVIERNFSMANGINNLFLCLDITNPSPNLGWEHLERMSLQERGPADMAFFLALTHHLVITQNIPFQKIAQFLSKVCHSLFIEFIGPNDGQVQKLLASHPNLAKNYTNVIFEKAFSEFFDFKTIIAIKDSNRKLYLMTLKNRP